MNSIFWKIIEKTENTKKTKENSKCSGEDFFKSTSFGWLKFKFYQISQKGVHMAWTLGA
jgi:hypothetical protein